MKEETAKKEKRYLGHSIRLVAIGSKSCER